MGRVFSPDSGCSTRPSAHPPVIARRNTIMIGMEVLYRLGDVISDKMRAADVDPGDVLIWHGHWTAVVTAIGTTAVRTPEAHARRLEGAIRMSHYYLLRAGDR